MLDRLDFILRKSRAKTGRIVANKLYRVYCDECSTAIAYRPASSKKEHRCRSCACRARFKNPTLNPMYGKVHSNREKFRKRTYTNVDYDDRQIVRNSNGNKTIKYRQWCPICKNDIGYRPHNDAHRKCIACQADINRKNSSIQNKLKASMKASLSSRLKNRLLNKNKKSTFHILGYSVDELKSCLESRFQSGMSWDNYGEWHIDHIVPDSWFNYSSVEDIDFFKSWSLDNLQPMWAKDNLKKSNKYKG